jgi:hypothetical protein
LFLVKCQRTTEAKREYLEAVGAGVGNLEAFETSEDEMTKPQL